MKFGKTIKKVAALGIGVSMLGATLVGAMAEDLSDLPGLFIDNETGAFNGVFVQPSTGADGSAEGILSAWFAASAVRRVSVDDGSEDAESRETLEVEGGFQIGTGDEFNLGENFNDITTSVGDDFELLSDEELLDQEGTTRADESYQQFIEFDSTGTSFLRFAQDEDEGAEFANYYIHFDEGNDDWIFEYKLVFDDTWDYVNSSSASADLVGATFEIMGQHATVITASFGTDQAINASGGELGLLIGDNYRVFSQGESITVDVNGVDVVVDFQEVSEPTSSTSGACVFNVGGTTAVIEDDTAETINGLTIGVVEVHALHSGDDELNDLCKAVVGGKELTFRHDAQVQINDEDVDDVTDVYAKVMFTETGSTSSTHKIDEFNFSVRPDNEIYLVKGDSWVEPVLEGVQFVFSDLVRENLETISVTSSGEDGALRFVNDDGREVEFEMIAQKGGTSTDPVLWGDNDDDVADNYYFQGEACVGTTSITDCEDARYVVLDDEDVHIVQIDRIDTNENKLDVSDLTYSTERNNQAYTPSGFNWTAFALNDSSATWLRTSATNTTVQLSGTTSHELVLNETLKFIYFKDLDVGSSTKYTGNYADVDGIHSAIMGTKHDGTVVIYDKDLTDRVVDNISFSEYNDGETLPESGYLTAGVLNVSVVYDDDSDNAMEFSLFGTGNFANNATGGEYGYGGVDSSEEDDETDYYVTFKGTECVYDSEDKVSFVCTHPRDAVYAVVQIADATSETRVGTAGDYLIETVPIPGVVHLYAEEVDDVSAVNAVLLGGPCANSATEAVLGYPSDCFAALGIQEGQAIVKLMENDNGNWALIIAGWNAVDTRNAAAWLVDDATASDLRGEMEVFLHTVERSNVRVLSLSELGSDDDAMDSEDEAMDDSMEESDEDAEDSE